MSESDLQLARMLLGGYLESSARGKLRSVYLKEGSSREQDARRAISRLLRSDAPLDRQLRTVLAHLFDPDPPAWEQRTIRLKARGRGRPIDHVTLTQIAEYIWNERQNGKRVTDAINDAAEQFALSEETIKEIWSRYRPLLKRIYSLPLAPEKQG
jgi:hypothetical protein